MHEVDALGGEIGRMADRTYLQKRVLNRSKVRRLCTHGSTGSVLRGVLIPALVMNLCKKAGTD